MEGSDPCGEVKGCPNPCHPLTSPVPHQRPKKGGRSLHHLPSRAARRWVARGGTRVAQPRFAYPQRMREIRVVPRPMRRFGKVPHHNGEGAPSERKALWVSKACTTWLSHPWSERGTPIRRHLLDPQRRKSSIIPRSWGEPVSCSDSSPRLRGTGP